MLSFYDSGDHIEAQLHLGDDPDTPMYEVLSTIQLEKGPIEEIEKRIQITPDNKLVKV